MQLGLLGFELLGVTLRQGTLFGATFQGFQVFADALLVVEDFLLLVVDFGELAIERRDVIFLFDDFAKFRFDFGIDGFLLEEDLELVVVEIREGVASFDRTGFAHDECGSGL
jgi:hypothetical protein